MQSVLIAVGFDSRRKSSAVELDSRQKAVQWIANGAAVTPDETASQQLGLQKQQDVIGSSPPKTIIALLWQVAM